MEYTVPQGYVEFQGHAELISGEPIYAPLSLRPCIWYRYQIEKKRARSVNNNSNNWQTIEQGVCDSLFYLIDSTGRCVVDPEGAIVTPSTRDVWYGSDRNPGKVGKPAKWLRYSGLAQIGRRYRYREELIVNGDPLYALGDFATHGGAGGEFDEPGEIADLLREWKRDKARLLERFDANNDGEIDVDEWDSTRRAAVQEIAGKRAKAAAAVPIDVLGHAKGSRNPFILAARSESDMLTRFHYNSIALFVLSVISSVTVLWTISIR
ncbi:MAG: GIDE domain-containing protein [Proteobacteria bacterium]|nr:GIDE domain-containing protein [Pseudomonadota bacterium]